MSPLVKLEILGCFLTHWLPMTSILLGIARCCRWLFKGNYLKNERAFYSFLFHFWNFQQILNIFQKKKVVEGIVFPKLQNLKDFVRPHFRKSHFRTSFDSKHVKRSQTLVKSAWLHFYHIFSSLWRDMIWKTSTLIKCEILGLFVNTMTADASILFRVLRISCWLFKGNYLKNEKVFLGFLFHFWNFQQILNIFKKKKVVIANVFVELKNVKDLVRPHSKKHISELLLNVIMLKGPKHLRNLHDCTFIKFFISLRGYDLENIPLG